MLKFALGIEYDGSQFHGWQIQPELRTAQGALEQALLRLAGGQVPIHVTCAGRTDTGVHAMNQVVHFETDIDRSLRSWIYGTNNFLPKDMTVKWAEEVPEDFDARFSAISRRYRYIIYNHNVRPAHLRSLMTWQYHNLDVDLMHEEAQSLLGENDFSSFRSSQCQSNTAMRCVHQVCVKQVGALILLDIEANAFLHHMVRNIAGVLIAVGSGRKSKGYTAELLALKDRTQGVETAPPYGLFLYDVIYPEEYKIPGCGLGPLHIDSPFAQRT